MKAGDLISNGISAISNISSIVNIGNDVANFGSNIYNRSVQFTIINKQLITNQTFQAGVVNNGQNTYWINYDGTEVTVYKGQYGNAESSTIYKKYPGTSGLQGFENSSQQGEKDAGPVPEGNYSINLTLSFTRKAPTNTDGST